MGLGGCGGGGCVGQICRGIGVYPGLPPDLIKLLTKTSSPGGISSGDVHMPLRVVAMGTGTPGMAGMLENAIALGGGTPGGSGGLAPYCGGGS